MTYQALLPNGTNKVYMPGWSGSHHFVRAGVDLLSSLPVLVQFVSALEWKQHVAQFISSSPVEQGT